MSISDYLDERLITFLDVKERNEAILTLVDLLHAHQKLRDHNVFYRAILEREKVVSTGIGMSVAIPHAKLKGYQEFFIAVGIQKTHGIEWGALDGSLVRLIFLIGGPDHKQTEYLQILSGLTNVIKDEERRKLLLKAGTPKEVIDLFRGY